MSLVFLKYFLLGVLELLTKSLVQLYEVLMKQREFDKLSDILRDNDPKLLGAREAKRRTVVHEESGRKRQDYLLLNILVVHFLITSLS